MSLLVVFNSSLRCRSHFCFCYCYCYCFRSLLINCNSNNNNSNDSIIGLQIILPSVSAPTITTATVRNSNKLLVSSCYFRQQTLSFLPLGTLIRRPVNLANKRSRLFSATNALIPAPANADALSRRSCQRTLPLIFGNKRSRSCSCER